MSRYIDIEPLMTPDNMVEEREDTGIDELPYKIRYGLDINVIRNAPTADVVEVVRCKDCKYLYCLSAIDRRFYCRHYPHGLEGINIIEDNPYCSYGERKENNG